MRPSGRLTRFMDNTDYHASNKRTKKKPFATGISKPAGFIFGVNQAVLLRGAMLDGKMKYWEIIADNLSKAGWSWGCVSAIDSNGRTIFVADHIAMTESVSLCVRMKS